MTTDVRSGPADTRALFTEPVLRRMRGRAILADEVGLGKTIEAGLILSELRLRGLADRVLVLIPAGLVEQWRDELERKFGLPTAILTGRTGVPDRRGGGPVLLASLAAARRDPLKSEPARDGWDLVVSRSVSRPADSTHPDTQGPGDQMQVHSPGPAR